MFRPDQDHLVHATGHDALLPENCFQQMPVKIARSTPRPSFGLRELLVASHISRLASRDAAKSLLSTLVSESSGECRLILLPPFAPLAARCAFTIVLSIKYKLSRDFAASASKIHFQTPRRDQRLNRLYF